MSKKIPSIQKYMTTQPHTVGANETIGTAKQLMSEFKIRHLPVMEHGNLIGIVSDRDIKLFCGFDVADPEDAAIRDICVKDPYTASPDAQMDEVAAQMAENHYGCAVIVQNQKVVGIFTTVDACRVLAEVLQTRYHH